MPANISKLLDRYCCVFMTLLHLCYYCYCYYVFAFTIISIFSFYHYSVISTVKVTWLALKAGCP